MTFKDALKRGLIGFPIGVFISTTISIIISAVLRDCRGNTYCAVTPDFIQVAGNEINAVILQYLLSGILGFALALASLIYEIDAWSITKRTIVHFLLIAGVLMPIAYICRWFSFIQFTLFFILFIIIYFIIWIIQYKYWKKKVKKLNDKLKEK